MEDAIMCREHSKEINKIMSDVEGQHVTALRKILSWVAFDLKGLGESLLAHTLVRKQRQMI